jgi:uncharacterized protein (DUF427 family)
MTEQATGARGPVRVEVGEKRIHAYVSGELVADTTPPLLVWEKPYYPTCCFHASDVRTELLAPEGGVARSPSRGDGHLHAVRAGRVYLPGAALRYHESPFAEHARAVTVVTATADVDNLRFYQRCGFRAVSIERDAFTPEKGYAADLTADGIPLRGGIRFTLELGGSGSSGIRAGRRHVRPGTTQRRRSGSSEARSTLEGHRSEGGRTW